MAEQTHIYLNTLSPGSEFTGIYYVQDVVQKIAKNGNPYTTFTIKDKTKTLNSRYWGKISFPSEEYYEVSGICEVFNDNLEVKINTVSPLNLPCFAEVDGEPYMETVEDIELEKKKFDRCIKTISDMCLKGEDKHNHIDIINYFLTTTFLMRYYIQPGDLNGYSKRGGLILKTTRLFSIVNTLCNTYDISVDDRLDLLTVVMLHGIGVVDRIITRNFIASSTQEYDCCGYIFYTANMLEAYKKEHDSMDSLVTILQGLLLGFAKNSFEQKSLKEFILSMAFMADKKINELKKA